MHTVILHMTALIACGVFWRLIQPGGLDADTTRRVLTTLVYYLLLPVLVIQVLWKAPLGLSSFGIAAGAAAGVLASIALSTLICRSCKHDGKVTGAVVLAASFPNATYMGLPVLESLYGEIGRSIAIQYDLFACTPLLLTVGILIARIYGQSDNQSSLWLSMLKVPPLWAALVGVLINLSGIAMPVGLDQWMEMLAAGVIQKHLQGAVHVPLDLDLDPRRQRRNPRGSYPAADHRPVEPEDAFLGGELDHQLDLLAQLDALVAGHEQHRLALAPLELAQQLLLDRELG